MCVIVKSAGDMPDLEKCNPPGIAPITFQNSLKYEMERLNVTRDVNFSIVETKNI